MFSYDWFHGVCFEQQQEEARRRCVRSHFADYERSTGSSGEESKEIEKFRSELEVRTLIYLRDGFSYEIRAIAEVDSKSHLIFECEPVDEQYKVGSFVVTVPFDEIVRVEVFAVHPGEKPRDAMQITGFRGHPDTDHKYDSAPVKPAR